MDKIRITTVVENSVHQRGLRAEHGLAFHVQSGERSILFDTGPGDLILQNAGRLKTALDSVEAVVLSHGHYDHTGGLARVLGEGPNAKVFFHPAALEPRYVRDPGGTARTLGISQTNKEALINRQTIQTTGMTEIIPGAFTTGEILRETSFEDVGGAFFLDEACTVPDPIIDDQALFFESREGIVVLLGCAHAGVVNTISHIQSQTNGKSIYAIMGGMHLLNADANRLKATVEALGDFGVKQIAPAHCTGAKATAVLWSAFPGRCSLCSVGTVFEFELI